MAKFKPYKVDQLMLLPNSLDNYIPENHLSRAVHKVVERLDTTTIENKYSDLGQNTYHPKILIKLLFYGYAIGERSGRKISSRIETDTAYIYLAQMYKPDFRTINDFRKNNIEEIAGYFVDIVRMCKELDMIKIGQINIDGTKIKANAANRLTKTKKEYEEWDKRIDKKIKDILDEAGKIDEEEDRMYGDKRGDELPEAINTDEKLQKKLEEVMKKFRDEKEKGKEKINLTDNDAKFMKGGDGKINTGYNCQIATTNEQFIVEGNVITDANDSGALVDMVDSTEMNLQEEVNEVVADTGYSNYDNYEYLASKNKIGYIPDRDMKNIKNGNRNAFCREKFRYNKAKDIYVCPEDKILKLFEVRREMYRSKIYNRKIYKGKECHLCLKRSLCTKQKQRIVTRENRIELLEDMRKRLLSEEGKKKYKKRLHTTEPVFGHLKYNLGYRHFLLRTLEKVKAEFKLMCIGWNIKKMHRVMALSG